MRKQGLEELLRGDLREERGLVERRMFGGLAWLLRGRLLCAAREDGMLVRLGKERVGWALEEAGVEPVKMGERLMAGWVRLGSEACENTALRERLLGEALSFVRTLPSED